MHKEFCPKCAEEIDSFYVTTKFWCDWCGKEVPQKGQLVEIEPAQEDKERVEATGHDWDVHRFISLRPADQQHRVADRICCIDCMIKFLQAARVKQDKP